MQRLTFLAVLAYLFFLVLPSSTLAQWGRSTTLNATYKGLGQDRVGTWGQPNANGQPDGHFSLVLDTGGIRRVVNYMVIHSANSAGKPVGGQVWDTKPGGYWILGVYKDFRRLNPKDENIRDEVRGPVHYEVFGNDSGWFKPGQRFRITVQFEDGGKAVAFARVAGGAPPPPPPPAPPPSQATLTASFVDKSQDKVGRGGKAHPNGQKDGHFSLFLHTGGIRRVVTYMVLHSANDAGTPAGGQIWDTTPNGYWILGVYRGWRRLNPKDQNIRDVVQKTARYEIYGNDSGWFKPGQNFRITVKFEDGGKAVAFARVAGGAPPPPPPSKASLSASYKGMGHDVVGRGSDTKGNGQKDGKFSLELNTGGKLRVVSYVVLHTVDSTGTPMGGQVWDTKPGGYWILGVYRNGRRLNYTDTYLSDAVQGQVHYEIYGNDSGWFRPGQRFRITIKFEDGGEAVAFARVAGSAPPPPTPPPAGTSLAAYYRGMEHDVVGRGSDTKGNGQKDGKFHLKLDTGGRRRVVTNIVLQSANNAGHPWGGQVWNTKPDGYWILGVYRQGKRLNYTDTHLSDVVHGSAQYDIYGNDSGWFKPGRTFLITVKFADGGEVATLARVGR